ncbi:MAG: hypothetical protein ACOX18_04490 [Bacillota bacterium]|jgi:hypothetical protein
MDNWDERDWIEDEEFDLLRPLGKRTDMLGLLSLLDEEDLADIIEINDIDLEAMADLSLKPVARVLVAAARDRLDLLDEGCADLMRRVALSSGRLVAADYDEVEERVLSLRDMGLLFPALNKKREPILLLPDEIRSRWGGYIRGEEFRRRAAENTQILQMAAGVLSYYGILSDSELLQVLQQLGITVAPDRLTGLIHWVGEGLDYVYRFADGWTGHSALVSPFWLQQEQELRPSLKPRPLTPEEVRDAATALLQRPAYQQFRQHMLQLGIDQHAAGFLLRLLANGLRNDDPDLLEQLQSYLMDSSEEGKAAAAEWLQRLRDETPLWILKGYTPAEIRGMYLDISTDPLVERKYENDADDAYFLGDYESDADEIEWDDDSEDDEDLLWDISDAELAEIFGDDDELDDEYLEDEEDEEDEEDFPPLT